MFTRVQIPPPHHFPEFSCLLFEEYYLFEKARRIAASALNLSLSPAEFFQLTVNNISDISGQ